MKYTDQITVERPLKKVFHWMSQPQHITQLVTTDFTKEFVSHEPIPEHLIGRAAEARRFRVQAETEITIENLSTPSLQARTTFQYKTGVRSRSEEFPAWKPVSSGSILIKKCTPPTFFSFTQRGSSFSREYSLAFQAQQKRTIITYNSSTPSGNFGLMIASAIVPAAVTLGQEVLRQQLQSLKVQMELEID